MATAISKALKAAMEGPEAKDLHVFGHDWNIKKATMSKSGTTLTIKGQISHNVAFTVDDQILYEFVFKKDKLEKHDVKIAEHGWGSIVGRVLSVVTGGLVPSDDIESLANKVENMTHGEWQVAGQQLALRIALEGYKRNSKPVLTSDTTGRNDRAIAS